MSCDKKPETIVRSISFSATCKVLEEGQEAKGSLAIGDTEGFKQHVAQKHGAFISPDDPQAGRRRLANCETLPSCEGE